MKKKRKSLWRPIVIVVVIVILLANYTPLNLFFRQNYTYQNADGSFSISEEYGKGFDFDVIKNRYAHFLSQHPDKSANRQLYRTFTLQPWNIGQWHEMIFHSERFKLPKKPDV